MVNILYKNNKTLNIFYFLLFVILLFFEIINLLKFNILLQSMGIGPISKSPSPNKINIYFNKIMIFINLKKLKLLNLKIII